jgi:serine/threonine protein kinase
VGGHLAPGSELSGHTIASVLGEGGAATVYLARRPGGGECALKVLTEEAAGDPTYVARFGREARHMASLRHPSIVRLFETGRAADGTLFLAMQYVAGRDLGARIARGVLDAKAAHLIAAQIASALDYAHSHGVVHRDVKPGNVLIADEGWPLARAYLTDFGFGKNPSTDSVALTERGKFVGTPGYTAPEEVQALPSDHRVDVYSLACLLYECFIGEPPFVRRTPMESLKAHLSAPRPSIVEYRPDLPAALDSAVARGMAIAPSDRFDTCAEFVDAVGEALVSMGIDLADVDALEAVRGPEVEQQTPPKVMSSESAPARPRPAPARPAAALKLVATEGPAAGSELILREETILARATSFDGALEADGELSRRHARVYRESGSWMLEDLGSANGTFLNGLRVCSPEPLRSGDEISIGASVLVACEVAAPPDSLMVRLELDPRTGIVEIGVEGGERLLLAARGGSGPAAIG